MDELRTKIGCTVLNSNLNTASQHIPGKKQSNTAAALSALSTCTVPPPRQSQPHPQKHP